MIKAMSNCPAEVDVLDSGSSYPAIGELLTAGLDQFKERFNLIESRPLFTLCVCSSQRMYPAAATFGRWIWTYSA